jgi:hypothetical protein
MAMSAAHGSRVLSAVTFVAGIAMIAIVAVFLAERPALRLEIDATKTRAYTLSPRTRGVLDKLDGEWTVGLVLIERDADPDVLAQVDEVLRRYDAAADNVTVFRCDPTDPEAIAAYEGLLARLQSTFAGDVAKYDDALENGMEAFRALEVFAASHVGRLDTLLAAMTPGATGRDLLESIRSALGEIVRQGDQLEAAIVAMRRTSAVQPIADYEGARSALYANHGHWANQLNDVALAFDGWTSSPDVDDVALRYATTARDEYIELAQALKISEDELSRLPELELELIGRRLRDGEVGIVMGPDRATVIPSWQLFPKTPRAGAADRGPTFDRRFRGEQLITAAIDSLLVDSVPLVVFVHAEEGSLLQQRPQDLDLRSMADVLRVQRWEVAEWGLAGGERPVPDAGQPVVYVVVPPIERVGLEMTPAERRLLDEVELLIDEGASVLLSVSQSPLPYFRQPDAWAGLAEQLGVDADTAHVILEQTQVSETERRLSVMQQITTFDRAHAVGAATDGRLTAFWQPLALAPVEVPDGGRREVLASIEPGPGRWRENQWWRPERLEGAPPAEARLETPAAVAMAVERLRPDGPRSRAVIIGSGWWLLTQIADAATPLGGERFALAFPGNRELMLASVAWLAGREDLIVPGASQQGIATIEAVTPATRFRWRLIAWAIMPLSSLGIGLLVWSVRRRAG